MHIAYIMDTQTTTPNEPGYASVSGCKQTSTIAARIEAETSQDLEEEVTALMRKLDPQHFLSADKRYRVIYT